MGMQLFVGEVMINQRVWFIDWKEVLEREDLSTAERARYYHWIIQYLKFCKNHHAVVCEATAQTFETQPDIVIMSETTVCKQALAWFFQRAQERSTTVSGPPSAMLANDVPPLAKADFGNTEWGELGSSLNIQHFDHLMEDRFDCTIILATHFYPPYRLVHRPIIQTTHSRC